MNDDRPLAYTTSTGDEPVAKVTADANDPALQPTKRIAKKTTKKRRPRVGAGSVGLKKHIVVDPRIMAAAKAAILPGQRLVIVDAECVRLVNVGGGA